MGRDATVDIVTTGKSVEREREPIKNEPEQICPVGKGKKNAEKDTVKCLNWR